MSKVREYTDRLLEAVEEGMLSKDDVIMACVKYMSEADVKEMCQMNDFFQHDEDADEPDQY